MAGISKRADLGGVITEEDKLKFRERIAMLLKRDRRRKLRRRKKKLRVLQAEQHLF